MDHFFTCFSQIYLFFKFSHICKPNFLHDHNISRYSLMIPFEDVYFTDKLCSTKHSLGMFFGINQSNERAMAGSYAYFPKALLRLSPSEVMTRLWVFLYTQVAQLESSV